MKNPDDDLQQKRAVATPVFATWNDKRPKVPDSNYSWFE
jgi:hypothetical protein